MKTILAIILLLFALPAHATQFDAIFHYSSAAAAKADLADHYDGASDTFLADHVVVVQAWRNSLDTTDAQGNVVHTFLAGFFVLVSADHLILALRDDPALQVVLNRDLCNARQVGCVVKSNVSAALLQDVRFSPLFAGSDIPFGALQ